MNSTKDRSILAHWKGIAEQLEAQLADKVRELDCIIDRSTEHEMQRYHLRDKLAEAEAQLAARDEQLAAMRDMLWVSFRLVADLKEGDAVQYVGAHVLRADKGYIIPEVGFVEWSEEEIAEALSSAPAVGRVLWKGALEVRMDAEGLPILVPLDDMGPLEALEHQEFTVIVRKDVSDGRKT